MNSINFEQCPASITHFTDLTNLITKDTREKVCARCWYSLFGLHESVDVFEYIAACPAPCAYKVVLQYTEYIVYNISIKSKLLLCTTEKEYTLCTQCLHPSRGNTVSTSQPLIFGLYIKCQVYTIIYSRVYFYLIHKIDEMFMLSSLLIVCK